MMEAFCSECKLITDHDEIGEDDYQIYLKCSKCGTERTWFKVPFSAKLEVIENE